MTGGVSHLAIVAGGRGTRLAPVISDRPKVLVPVGGQPVLAHHLSLAARSGIADVTVYAGYLADRIQDFVGDGAAFGVRVRVRMEEEPLGTAGAILQTLDALPEHFFVIYGDVLVAADLPRMAAYHLDRRADFTLLVQPTDHPQDSDLLELDADDRVTAIHPCPHPPDRMPQNIANAALYVIRRDALRLWAEVARPRDFIKDVVAGLLTRGASVVAYRSDEFVQDMGTPSRLAAVEARWRLHMSGPS